ncbi:ATP-binding protein [Moraxella nonliquefaciens]|jgi:predicted transcriptional regulator containing an HTH domain|uniref:ATP-binding protein n=1 Tax=Moraxella nonliquefaciens TaxID=478 RepID=UPI000A7CDF88|nr:ATP-binding protein [Moraxella nonliquefaciens]
MINEPISKIDSQITLKYLQTQHENQYFERKGLGERDIKPSKIADELIGMANADGGILVFGVSDKGEIQDLQSLGDKLDNYRKLVFDFIAPPCKVQLEEVFVDDKLIFIFHVEQDLETMFFRKDNETFFLRVADSNRELNQAQIKKLEYDKNIRLFEDEAVIDFDSDDLDQTLLQEYQQKVNFKGDLLDLLYKKHLLSKKDGIYQFKKSCVLLFSQNPEKYIPSASVRYVRFEGLESKTGTEHNVIKDVRFENNIPNLIDKIRQFLHISFKEFFFLDINIGKFKKVPEYPEEAWLEAVVNALCHRSYNVQGNAIYIKHFDDRLEISNSGPLPAQVTVDNIRTERFARNPRIARVLEDFNYVRQLNEGVKRIYESMEKSMLAKPIYEVRNGNVYLTLRNNISLHNKTIHADLMKKIEENWHNYNDTERNILVYIFGYGNVTAGEIAQNTQVHINTVRKYLNKFVENERILTRFSDKQRDINAKYGVNKDVGVLSNDK